MKKILLLLILGCMTSVSFSQNIPGSFGRTEAVAAGVQTFLLCSTTGLTTGGAFCGCSGGCVGVSCATAASGNCVRDPQTLTLTIPADLDVTVDIIENGACGQGLDTSDDYFVNGVLIGNGTTFPYSDCFFTEMGSSGVITVGVDSNRPDECITVTVTAVANGGVGGDGTPGCLNPLPVEYVSYKATAVNDTEVRLDWTTASELNNSHFDVQYSLDGVNFRTIDEVIGNGTTQLKQDYSYIHTSPVIGLNYYRLKQVDFDGAFQYSELRAVRLERTGKIVINPSAAIAEITVELAEVTGDNSLIEIYDMVGRSVLVSNFDGALNTKTLDISNLQKGYYVVRVQAGSEIFTERFMKMVD